MTVPDTASNRRSRLGAAVLAAWLLLLVVVPLVRLTEDPTPNRFVWRMFSFTTPVPEYTVHTASSEFVADLSEVVARMRSDVPFDQFMPEHLCGVHQDALTITWENGNHACVNP